MGFGIISIITTHQQAIFGAKNAMMTRSILQQRTKQFHIDVIKLCEHFPKNAAGYETAKQLIRSAGSVGANYRASARAKSTPDFIYKMEIILEEADESLYWMEVVRDLGMIKNIDLERLISEANELTAIFATAVKTVKKRRPADNEK